MNKWKRKFFGIFLILFFSQSHLFSAKIYPKAGSTSATFLKIDAGARAAAMGGAFSAICDDSSAVYWNPAGLSRIYSTEASALYSKWFQNIDYSFITYATPLGIMSGFGAGLIAMRLKNDIERRSGSGEIGVGGVINPQNPLTDIEGYFGARDIAGIVSYGRKMKNNFSIGMSLKIIQQKIDINRANGWAFDFGAFRGFGKLNLAFTVTNLGTKIKFFDKGYPLPTILKMGSSYRFSENLNVGFDAEKPSDNYPLFRFGLEWKALDFVFKNRDGKIFVRGGYRWRLYGNPLEGWSGLTTGLGLGIGNFYFDYAFVPYGFLENTHRISLAWKFGKVKKNKKIPKVKVKKTGPKPSLKKTQLKWEPLIIASPDRMLWSIKIKAMSPSFVTAEVITRQAKSNLASVSLADFSLPEDFRVNSIYESGVKISTTVVGIRQFLFNHNLDESRIEKVKIVFILSKKKLAVKGINSGEIKCAEFKNGIWSEIPIRVVFENKNFCGFVTEATSLNKILVYAE